MYNEILVPTDGSDVAERAGTVAVQMAELFGADLTVVSVREPGTEEQAERAVGDIEEAAIEAGLSPQTEIIDDEKSAIHQAIIDYAEDHGVDVVVMGTHGRTGISRFLLGSVAEQFLQESPVPVVTIHEDTVIDFEIDNVLVPTDGSEGSEAATEHAIDLVTETGGTIHALYVTSGPEAESSPTDDVRDRGEAAGVEVVSATRSGRPHEAIAGYTAEAEIDVVVMGTHGRTGLRRYLLGSVTERTVRFSPVPVVSVKPESAGATVEFLDYEVIADNDWSLEDDDLFEKAAEADLTAETHGTMTVEKGEYILEAAEAEGYDWPFFCRGGGCINCAATLVDGEVEMEVNRSLSDEEVDEMNLRLTCVATPTTDEVKLVYNAKQLDQLRDRIL
ncbi:ferredoxin Fer [Natrialba swarupiae]|uniref:2Fe-2S iron-sulfur cluster binding domain-containing protein n=1 Tax=Natrialba swarupiae TaxID=2448032 RepID=A0A5D5AKD5_9EURY|nr:MULTISPECIES: ferredoxin Fer [Natrialba]MWV39664.1 2Fe-2S iron-sulfur cluster binding domain-containing protein [Natrialba sp. INN-245]TYT62229.1 2Fe-2S iron-sulfur cluster binding domain-containing protein [Natrialba swarupiae]